MQVVVDRFVPHQPKADKNAARHKGKVEVDTGEHRHKIEIIYRDNSLVD